MKFHLSYATNTLEEALSLATLTAPFVDIMGISPLLLYKEGIKAVSQFRAEFPTKEIFVEANLTEKTEFLTKMFSMAGATYISVAAGTFYSNIQRAVITAKERNVKIVLNLLDTSQVGQVTIDAKNLGVHSLIFNQPSQEAQTDINSLWLSVRENTQLPIFISSKIALETLPAIAQLNPYGVMVGSAIIKAQDPVKEAKDFAEALRTY
jgi:3-hexulose-6-phosphate synthase